ncbi:hypothetical protein Tco_0105000, partial [Tanacetum coccineum]
MANFVPVAVVLGPIFAKLMDLSGERKIPKANKFFLLQQIAEERSNLNVIRCICEDVRKRLSKLHGMIRELELIDHRLDVVDMMVSLRDAMGRRVCRRGLCLIGKGGWSLDGIRVLIETSMQSSPSYTYLRVVMGGDNDMQYTREEEKLLPLLGLVDQLVKGIRKKEGHVDMMDFKDGLGGIVMVPVDIVTRGSIKLLSFGISRSSLDFDSNVSGNVDESTLKGVNIDTRFSVQ